MRLSHKAICDQYCFRFDTAVARSLIAGQIILIVLTPKISSPNEQSRSLASYTATKVISIHCLNSASI